MFCFWYARINMRGNLARLNEYKNAVRSQIILVSSVYLLRLKKKKSDDRLSLSTENFMALMSRGSTLTRGNSMCPGEYLPTHLPSGSPTDIPRRPDKKKEREREKNRYLIYFSSSISGNRGAVYFGGNIYFWRARCQSFARTRSFSIFQIKKVSCRPELRLQMRCAIISRIIAHYLGRVPKHCRHR